jgi:VWFA-related protein
MPRVLLVVLCACAAGATVGAGPQQPTFHADTHTVSVYTTVTDEEGRLAPDLTRDEFEVYDNGVRQTLTVFDSGVQPITLVMMLDRSGSMTKNYELVRDAAEAFIDNLLPADRTRIGSFSSRIQIDPDGFTSDKATLRAILRGPMPVQGPTPLWNATALAMDALAREDGRRVVLTFTDGKDTPGWMTTHVEASDILRRSQTEEIMIYAIGLSERCTVDARASGLSPQRGPFGGRFPGGGGGGRIPGPFPHGLPPRGPRIPGLPGPDGPEGGIPRPTWPSPLPPARDTNSCADAGPDPELRTLAEEGGGGYFELRGTDNLRSTFARVADELHRQYLIAFDAETLDGRLHQLEVRVRRPHLVARARRSYVASRTY